MPALRAALPDHLEWLTERVESLVKPAAYMLADRGRVAPVGGTFTCGRPDAPFGAAWASVALGGHWNQSPYDGTSFWLQLNLEDIPAEVRKPEWPTVGVVWLTLDLSDSWRADVVFDPRPAKSIPWHPRPVGVAPPCAVSFVLRDTVPDATDGTLPEIASDFRGGVGMAVDYTDWVDAHYGGRQPSDIQIGGWIWPCQSDFDDANGTVVLAFERQPFGDSGALYLHYTPEHGFWADAQTH